MTDFEKIFNTFKEVGIKMAIGANKSEITILEGASERSVRRFDDSLDHVDGTIDIDGYLDFFCTFSFDENGECTGCGVWE